MKTLKLTKQAFKNYFEGKRMVWILQDDNFLKLATKYEEIQKYDSYRYKKLTNKGYKFSIEEIPESLLDGFETGEKAKEYFRIKYPEFKIYDFSNKFNLKEIINETKSILENEDKIIIFEAGFSYQDFSLRTDIIIKNKGITKIIEVKAVTQPLKEHMYDLAYQNFIIHKSGWNIEHWHFNLMTLNNQYIFDQEEPYQEQILNLFKIGDYYYNSTPSKDEFKEVISKPLSLIEGIQNLQFNNDFEVIFSQIKMIQQLDEMPYEEISAQYNFFKKNDLIPFFKSLENINEENSIFNYRGDSGFTLAKKCQLFYEMKYKFIEEVPDELLIRKSFDINNLVSKKSTSRIQTLRNNKLIRLIQKDATIDKKEHIEKNLIKSHLKEYKLPIYMFDFEAVKFSIPRVNKTSPYEQIPYQYSIHIIHNLETMNYETGEGITHLEYLATDRKNFYWDLFDNLIEDLTKFGLGTYVAYNKAFEQMVIKNAMSPHKKIPQQKINTLEKINQNMIDLMVPFKEMYYYNPKQKGSYSIKYVTPIFTNLNYQDLNSLVRKGDQSAAQCKYWLLEDKDLTASNSRWKKIRPEMLEYCKYDTLSMVGIFEKLSKLVGV